MDSGEIKQIADFLLECHEALCEHDGIEAMMPCLHRLHQVSRRLTAAVPVTRDAGQRFMLKLMARKTRTLRREMEKRLAVRN